MCQKDKSQVLYSVLKAMDGYIAVTFEDEMRGRRYLGQNLGVVFLTVQVVSEIAVIFSSSAYVSVHAWAHP